MKRKALCDFPEPFQIHPNDSEKTTKTYTFELITPMLGGDNISWVLDEAQPVRIQAIKGQLRFWWRTMQSETDAAQLLMQENKIWGGKISEKSIIKSPISLAITETIIEQEHWVQARMSDSNSNAIDDTDIPGYVLFPIISVVKKHQYDVFYITKMTFKLTISYAREKQETILNTLRLWTLFGGIGARTRRGVGSLYCEELLRQFTNIEDIANFIRENSSSASEVSLKYPRLAQAQLFIKPGIQNTNTAWHELLTQYGKYRQARGGSINKPGRTYWSDADAIRRVTERCSSSHSPAHPDGTWFPRAAFGLPINSKFNTPSDPLDSILSPVKGSRYPSTMILKVIKLADNQTFCCQLLLNQLFPEALVLKSGITEYAIPASGLPSTNNFVPTDKIMRTDNPIKPNESIYQHLARFLRLGDSIL